MCIQLRKSQVLQRRADTSNSPSHDFGPLPERDHRCAERHEPGWDRPLVQLLHRGGPSRRVLLGIRRDVFISVCRHFRPISAQSGIALSPGEIKAWLSFESGRCSVDSVSTRSLPANVPPPPLLYLAAACRNVLTLRLTVDWVSLPMCVLSRSPPRDEPREPPGSPVERRGQTRTSEGRSGRSRDQSGVREVGGRRAD